ncbi:MAG: ATP-binding protein, partial [Mycobacteriales bacterium]
MSALVGRAGERARLGEWLARHAGHPRFALVEGEAGIGKTALMQTLAEDAKAAGLSVAWASGVEDAGVPPYWLWQQVADVGPDRDRFAFFEKLQAALTHEHGRLVVIDDVQWADEPSLLALRFVLRQPSARPLWICATRRIGDAGPGWERLGPDLLVGPDVERLTLRGLDEASAATLLQSIAERPLDADLLERAAVESG